MKRILPLLLLASFFGAFAQDNIVIRGYIFDKDNNQPLSLAAVQILNTQLGALSEDNGFFELAVPKVNLKDSLKASFIGYLPEEINIQNYRQGDTLRIKLGTSIATKQEAVVTAVSARGVLLHAIDSLKRNLFRDSLIASGLYRQYHKENGKYVRLIEADASVAFNVKSPYQYAFHELVQINQQRRSENYETNGDVHGDHFVDLLKENPFSYNKATMLNARNIDFFAPKFESEDSDQYVVKTQYKETSSAKLENARIWVKKGSYAITRIEVDKYPNPYYVKSRYAIDSRWQLQNEKDVIQLTTYKGKYVVSSIERVYNHHVLNTQTGQVDYIVEESFNLYFNRYDSGNVGEKIKAGKYSEFTSLYSSNYNYDEGFWKNYTALKEHPALPQIKTDLEHSKPLEQQFKEAGK
jgi:CarboxypepD_reg-like domain